MKFAKKTSKIVVFFHDILYNLYRRLYPFVQSNFLKEKKSLREFYYEEIFNFDTVYTLLRFEFVRRIV